MHSMPFSPISLQYSPDAWQMVDGIYLVASRTAEHYEITFLKAMDDHLPRPHRHPSASPFIDSPICCLEFGCFPGDIFSRAS